MPELIRILWIAAMAYSVFQGLMYGTRSAIMMDVTNPAVAATQFTAYMAMMNLAISIAASWQGVAVEAWGYPVTLLVDAVTGVLCIFLLPAMKREKTFDDGHAAARARRFSVVLGICCLSYLLYRPNAALFGSGQSMMGTFYTLVFIGSALFLLAGREALGEAAGRWRAAILWAAPLLLAMHLRYQVDKMAAGGARSVAEVALYVVPLFAGVVLLALSRRDWTVAEDPEALAAAT
jgi:PAT family beta-lactamase induction signal transducer AmpG